MTGEITFTDRGNVIEVVDRRPDFVARNRGRAKTFGIGKNWFRAAPGEHRKFYIRPDTREIVLRDESVTPALHAIIGTASPEEAAAQAAAFAVKKQLPAVVPSKSAVTRTPEQQAEQDKLHAQAQAERERRDRDFHVDVFCLAGCDEADVEAAIDEIGMPSGCVDRRGNWVSRMRTKLGIKDTNTIIYISRVLCGRG